MTMVSRLVPLALLVFPIFSHAAISTGGPPAGPDPQTNSTQGDSIQQKLNSEHAPASTFVPLAPIPGLTEGVVANSQGLANFLNNLYKYLIGLAAVLAVIMIIWGGLEIATQDSVSKQGTGRKKIREALYGLVLILSPALVFGIINPSILDLNFAKSLQPLDIHNTTSTSGSSATPVVGGSGIVPTNGCNTPTGTYLIRVSCATNDAANNYAASCAVQPGFSTGGNCPGGFNSSGQCTGGGVYPSAVCPTLSPQTYMFVDVNTSTGILGTGVGAGYLFKSTGTDNESTFVNACRAEGGKACVPLRQSQLQSLDTCPEYSFNIPQNAQNATKGGNCYSAYLTCTSPNETDTCDLRRPLTN